MRIDIQKTTFNRHNKQKTNTLGILEIFEKHKSTILQSHVNVRLSSCNAHQDSSMVFPLRPTSVTTTAPNIAFSLFQMLGNRSENLKKLRCESIATIKSIYGNNPAVRVRSNNDNIIGKGGCAFQIISQHRLFKKILSSTLNLRGERIIGYGVQDKMDE